MMMCQQRIKDAITSEERREELRSVVQLCEDYVQRRKSIILEMHTELTTKRTLLENGKLVA